MAVVNNNSRNPASRTTRTTTKKAPRSLSFLTCVVLCIMTGVLGFYGGVLIGSLHNHPPQQEVPSEESIEQRIQEAVQKASQEWLSAAKKEKEAPPPSDQSPRFPETVQDMAVGMVRVPRDEFASTFNIGVPLDPSERHNKDVLILYSSEEALPSDSFAAAEAQAQTTLPLRDVTEATANCDYLNVILTDHSGERRQCIALMGQYEAFHIQKFMRLPEPRGKLDSNVPLRYVNRGAQSSGRKSTDVPTQEQTSKYWSILVTYLSTFQSVLDQLKPIAEKAAINNTVVVMVCNFGQSELLLNYICSMKQRKLDLSPIVVFATDTETRDLMQGLGINVFYDETNYGAMPKDAARRYADKNFMAMMMAKVFCVHMMNALNYDVLFQDVDMLWYRNPLEHFHDTKSIDYNFDIYFQDDGNHALFYAPYSANTGFYYVRNNERTRYFFNSFLMAGDLILSTRSHQIPLVSLLAEHASMYGMKVKIFSRNEDSFPGGHAYHRRSDFMKQLFAGAVNPYIFHMSWTHNKDNKMKYFQQMGEWYLNNEVCMQKTVKQILGENAATTDNLESKCCVAEPTVVCHYRDKPSKIPCKDSPPIDTGGRSFW